MILFPHQCFQDGPCNNGLLITQVRISSTLLAFQWFYFSSELTDNFVPESYPNGQESPSLSLFPVLGNAVTHFLLYFSTLCVSDVGNPSSSSVQESFEGFLEFIGFMEWIRLSMQVLWNYMWSGFWKSHRNLTGQ